MDANITPHSFTYKDLLLRKLYYSVICSVLSQLVILQVYVFITNFNPLHPIEWALSVFRTFTTLTTWLFVIPFLTIVFAESIICAKDYVFKPSYCSTRFQKFIRVVSIHNVVLLFLNILAGTNLTWLFLYLGGGQYRSMAYECKGKNYCLNEGTFLLVSSGFWTGLYYFVKVYLSEKHLNFPVIYQGKVLQLKAQIVPLLKKSFTLSLWPTLYFIIFYWCCGEYMSENFSSAFGFLREQPAVSCLIYLQLWTFGAVYYFNMSLMRFFFNLFLTEPVEFPLVKVTPESLCLQESVNMQDLPIVQSLACLDLHNLAQWSKSRRQVFFSLSQPGGHPHYWNSLVETVLKLLTEYTGLLNTSIENPVLLKTTLAPVVPQNVFRPADRFRNLRNMCVMPSDPDTIDVEVTHNPLPGHGLSKIAVEKIKQKLQNFFNVVKILLGINFLFGELPQASIQKCLANGQVIIWASQGISDLACLSLEEDRFGIVQKDLPAIIATLVNLKQGLDKLNKTPALTRRLVGYDFNYKMKGAITAAVKRSLFNICRTFGVYVREFPLSKDVVLYLQTIYKP